MFDFPFSPLIICVHLDHINPINICDPGVSRYEKSSRFMKEGYERDFLRYLQSLLAEVERRIRRGHARLALSQAQQNAGVCSDSRQFYATPVSHNIHSKLCLVCLYMR